MRLDDYHDSLVRYARATSLAEVEALCAADARALGFDHFIYALRVPTSFIDSRLVMVDGYPPSWIEHYFVNDFALDDPVLAWCNRHVLPVDWSDLSPPAGAAARRVMDEARDYGLREGLSMPVHSPQGELGVLSFVTGAPAATARGMIREALPRVQLLATHLHEAVRRVAGLGDQSAETVLTPRERECLRWAADGKTSWEIARLLNTAERTVNFHLNNAMAKLQVSTRQHAVAKAVLQGLIIPRPF